MEGARGRGDWEREGGRGKGQGGKGTRREGGRPGLAASPVEEHVHALVREESEEGGGRREATCTPSRDHDAGCSRARRSDCYGQAAQRPTP